MKRMTTDHLEPIDEDKEVCLILTHEELEALYDGLDALYSQLETFKDDAKDDDMPSLEKIADDQEQTNRLSNQLSPIIKEIRSVDEAIKHGLAKSFKDWFIDQYLDKYIEVHGLNVSGETLDQEAETFCRWALEGLVDMPQYQSIRYALEQTGIRFPVADCILDGPKDHARIALRAMIRETPTHAWRAFSIKFRALEVEEITREFLHHLNTD